MISTHAVPKNTFLPSIQTRTLMNGSSCFESSLRFVYLPIYSRVAKDISFTCSISAIFSKLSSILISSPIIYSPLHFNTALSEPRQHRFVHCFFAVSKLVLRCNGRHDPPYRNRASVHCLIRQRIKPFIFWEMESTFQ